MQIDDDLGVWLHAPALRAIDENRLPVFDQAPSRGEAKLSLVAGEYLRSLPFFGLTKKLRNEASKEPRHERAFAVDTEVQACIRAIPTDFSETETRWAPIVFFDRPASLIAA
ncbi:hypothetical protein ACFSKM_04900 [Ancylobacter dichloromethanicus]